MCYPVYVMVYFAKGGLLTNVDAVFSSIVLRVMVWYRCYIAFGHIPIYLAVYLIDMETYNSTGLLQNLYKR